MTVLEAQNYLFHFFINKSSFSFEEDYESIKSKNLILTDSEEKCKAIFFQALKNLEVLQFVNCVSSPLHETGHPSQWWVLVKPFESHTQQIELSAHTIKLIDDIYKECANKFKMPTQHFNLLQIHDKDIQYTLQILVDIISELVHNKK